MAQRKPAHRGRRARWPAHCSVPLPRLKQHVPTQHNSQQPTDEDGDEAGGGSIGASIRAVGARQGALGNHHAAQGGSEWPSGMSGVRTAEAGDAAVGWPSASSTWESLAHQESMCTAFHSARTCLFRQIVWPHPGLPAPAICPMLSLVGQGDQEGGARGVAEHDGCAPVAEGAWQGGGREGGWETRLDLQPV